MLTNNFMKTFAQQHATCTSGPSLPSHIPDATDKHYSRDKVLSEKMNQKGSPIQVTL